MFVAEDSVVRWLNEAKADVQGLLDIACDEARHDEARQSLLSIQQAAVERWPAVDTLQRLAADFAKQRQVRMLLTNMLFTLTYSIPSVFL